MGICYDVIVEVDYDVGDAWGVEAHFNLGKVYELAECFPHQGWPTTVFHRSRVKFSDEDEEDELRGKAWGTLEEVSTLYGQERLARCSDSVHALFACARAFQERGRNVRLIIWNDT